MVVALLTFCFRHLSRTLLFDDNNYDDDDDDDDDDDGDDDDNGDDLMTDVRITHVLLPSFVTGIMIQ